MDDLIQKWAKAAAAVAPAWAKAADRQREHREEDTLVTQTAFDRALAEAALAERIVEEAEEVARQATLDELYAKFEQAKNA